MEAIGIVVNYEEIILVNNSKSAITIKMSVFVIKRGNFLVFVVIEILGKKKKYKKTTF